MGATIGLSGSVENKAFSLHSSQVCSLLWMTRGDDAGWLDTKYIVMVSHTTACEDKLNNTYLLTGYEPGICTSMKSYAASQLLPCAPIPTRQSCPHCCARLCYLVRLYCLNKGLLPHKALPNCKALLPSLPQG